jgi:hypothetical protein
MNVVEKSVSAGDREVFDLNEVLTNRRGGCDRKSCGSSGRLE